MQRFETRTLCDELFPFGARHQIQLFGRFARRTAHQRHPHVFMLIVERIDQGHDACHAIFFELMAERNFSRAAGRHGSGRRFTGRLGLATRRRSNQ